MRRHFLLTILLGAWGILLAEGAVEDGLYAVSSDKTGVPIHAIDGRTLYLGASIPTPIHAAFLVAAATQRRRSWRQEGSAASRRITNTHPIPMRCRRNSGATASLVRSLANNHTRYFFAIHVDQKAIPPRWPALVLGGQCVAFAGCWGGHGEASYSVEISDADFVAKIIARFHIVPTGIALADPSPP
jgi:hypothetical protein